MQPGLQLFGNHDFAYRGLGSRSAPPIQKARQDGGPAAGGHEVADRSRNIFRADASELDTLHLSDRPEWFLEHVPLHSAAPGASERIIQALRDDGELINTFLQAFDLLKPFGPGLVRAFLKVVARGIERSAEAAAPPAPTPVKEAIAAAGEFSLQLARLDIRLEVFSASSELNSGPNGISYTQSLQYASIKVSFLSLSATGAYLQETDPVRINIDGDTLSTEGLDSDASLDTPSLAAKVSPFGGESSLAPEIREAILDTADRIRGLLVYEAKHSAGADDPSPIVPRPSAASPEKSIHDLVHSLTEGFTPRIRLHL